VFGASHLLRSALQAAFPSRNEETIFRYQVIERIKSHKPPGFPPHKPCHHRRQPQAFGLLRVLDHMHNSRSRSTTRKYLRPEVSFPSLKSHLFKRIPFQDFKKHGGRARTYPLCNAEGLAYTSFILVPLSQLTRRAPIYLHLPCISSLFPPHSPQCFTSSLDLVSSASRRLIHLVILS
jgi:hypothetical protein